MIDKWDENEIAWLTTDLSDEEIAEKIGRSRTAVRKKRYQVTGHYVEDEKQRDIRSLSVVRNLYSDSIVKEARIMKLAESMRVRLMG